MMSFKNEAGKWGNKSTGYRKDNPGERRQAELLADEQSIKERKRTPASAREQWDGWVDRWLFDAYGGRRKESTTFTVYSRYWKRWRHWLHENQITAPCQLQIYHTTQYRDYREEDDIGINTIIHELKFMGVVMQRAIHLGYASTNPCHRLGIKSDPKAEKEVWKDDEASLVVRNMHDQPDWIQASLILGFYQAARLRQCEVPLKDIHLARLRITYWRSLAGRALTKGDKPFTQPIDPAALPLLEALIERRIKAGHKDLCTIDTPIPSVLWRRFLDSLGLYHLSHHGLRSTWITRAALSGEISLAQAKRFVNHGSTAVHSIYQRLCADDIAHVPAALGLPSLGLPGASPAS